MKKILTTILAGTLVAGAAFAADAKITLNFRSRMDAFNTTTTDDTTGTSDTTTTVRNWMNWDKGTPYASAADTFKFVLNGDRAGATFAVDITAGGSNPWGINEYSAWMNFPVGPGTLTLRTGNWKNGYADGNYRVKKDVDAQNGEGADFEKFKLGTIFSATRQLAYVDSLNAPANQYAIAGFADYGFDINDNVNVNILVGGVSSVDSKGSYVAFDSYEEQETNNTKTETTKVNWNSAFSSRAQVKVKDVLNAELIYKIGHEKGRSLYHTFGLYVMPQVLDALTLNIGGAAEVFGGVHGKNGSEKGDYFDWGVDLRMRYQVMDSLSITFFTNVSGTSLDSGRTIDKGNVGTGGKSGYIGAKTSKDTDNKEAAFKVAMWNNLSGRFKINDLLTATLNIGLVTPLSKADKNKNSYSPEWRVTPAVQIYAASNASLWAGVAISGASFSTNNNKDWSAFSVNIPVIFRVKM